MNIKYSILTLLLFIASNLRAQDNYEKINFMLGKPYEVVDAFEKDYFVEGDQMLAIKRTAKKIIIQKFNLKTLSQVKSTDYQDMNRDAQFESLLDCGGRYYYFYSLWDGKAMNEQVFAREIDFKKGEFTGEGKLVLSVKGKVAGSMAQQGFYNFVITEKFRIVVSLDSANIFIEYRKKPETRSDAKSYDVLGMNVFDKDLKEVWKAEVKMPYTEKKMDVLTRTIDKDANVYYVAKVYNDNSTDDKKSKEGPANYHIEMFRIPRGGASLDKTSINVDDKFIKNIVIFERGNNMSCAGYYTVGKDMDAVDGVFLFNLSRTGAVEDIKYYPIPLDVINQNISKRQVVEDTQLEKKKEKGKDKDMADMDNLLLREVTILADESLLLTGEQYYSVTRSDGKQVTTNYYYNNILVTKIKADGTLAWMKKLAKRQRGLRGRGGLSYFSSFNNSDNANYYLFLDNEKNKMLSLDKVPAEHVDQAGGWLASFRVDAESGAINKSYIFDTKNVKGTPVFQFQVGRIVKMNDDAFIVEVYKKDKEDVLIKLFKKNK